MTEPFFSVVLRRDDPDAAPALSPVRGKVRSLAESEVRDRQDGGGVRDELHPDHDVPFPQADAGHAPGRPAHVAHLALRKTDRHSIPRREEDVLRPVGEAGLDELIAGVEGDGDDPARARVGEGRERRLLDDAAASRHDDEPVGRELGDGQDGCDPLLRPDLQEIDERFSLGRPAHFGKLVDLEPVDPAGIREEEDIVVRGRREEVADESPPRASPCRSSPSRPGAGRDKDRAGSASRSRSSRS